ncbi:MULTISPECIES: type II toxin-antitoxin system Phd/YefM family antitoxin [Pseudanabaena]|uniref:Prevent-host-death family protein n=2 Tax=Pseudanabaena TaxID=1152 RepID=L8MW97_9CYAN|nr:MULTISPECIES: type II toxin-antitoxin system Phd/YefM family antitoxin [Pseudanabaena]ELS32242.1 prevent-host-death family protein [Pseudanabaena biceps PCC 7429]MDG3495523.1 type II toxin-antitoxin system Phd/YefM family antitoxin [Pseudanabaena catenata USMAC16]TYQ30169.1 type II toxin-antitoxin system Phd/YefM family antitoxin [Pseudanabaena sp. UWO310]
MVNVLQIGEVGTELSKLVNEVRDLHTQVVIEAEGKPVVAMVRYDYLANLLEALEDAIDSNLLKKAVASNDRFFSFEDVIDAHNKAHYTEVVVEDFTKI